MMLNYVFCNERKDIYEFTLKKGVRQWNIFFFLLEGEISVTFDGEKEQRYKAGDLVFFPKNVRFERKVIESISFCQVGVHFCEENVIFSCLRSGKLELSESEFLSAVNLVRQANNLLTDDKSVVLTAVEFSICAHYCRCNQRVNKFLQLDKDVNKVISYFEKNLSEKICIEELAKNLNLTHNGLIYKFMRVTGLTPIKYLTKLRLSTAKQLLIETDLRISEIAYKTGFYDAYYFSNAFKKFYGVSPKNFRKQV